MRGCWCESVGQRSVEKKRALIDNKCSVSEVRERRECVEECE